MSKVKKSSVEKTEHVLSFCPYFHLFFDQYICSNFIMLAWLCYLAVTLLFIGVAFGTVSIGGFVTWLLLPAIAGCFILNAVASWRIFFDPQRGFRNAFTGCLLMLPLFAFVLLPTYGIPLAITLLTMYYTRLMIRKDPTTGQMLRFTNAWRIRLASGFLAIVISFFLIALLLGSFTFTKNIIPIEGNAIILWR